MELDVTLERGVVVVAVAGRVDYLVAGDFEARVLPFARVDEIHGLVLDIADLTYISSGGLRVILMAARAFAQRSGGFALCSPSAVVRRLLDGTGFAQVLDVHDNRETALASLSKPQLNSP